MDGWAGAALAGNANDTGKWTNGDLPIFKSSNRQIHLPIAY
jgi:hypothetical protein